MNPTAQEATFLEALRTKTQAAHQGLEALEVSKSLMSPEVSKPDYALYLQLMAQVHQDVEQHIFPLLQELVSDLEERRKMPLLTRDLETLGYEIPEKVSVFDTKSLNTAKALGIFYTVEGSTLGGRFILKNINQVLGYDEASGAAYFNGYGNTTGSRWKTFLHILTTYEAQNGQSNEIIEGATLAFDAIASHFSSQPA